MSSCPKKERTPWQWIRLVTATISTVEAEKMHSLNNFLTCNATLQLNTKWLQKNDCLHD